MHKEKVIDRLDNPPVIQNTKQIDLGDMPEDMDVELAKVAIFEIVEETLSKFHDSNLESKAARHNIANEIFKHIVNEGFIYKAVNDGIDDNLAKKIVAGNFGKDTGIDADYEQAIADIEADDMMSDYAYEQDQINELESQKEHTKDIRVLASTKRAKGPSPVPGGTDDNIFIGKAPKIAIIDEGEKDGKSRSSDNDKND